MENNNVNTDLIISFLSGNTSPDEEIMLQNWINQSSENKLLFNNIKNTWFASTQVSSFSRFKTFAALEKTHDKMNDNSESKNIALYKMLKIAAVIVIAFLAGGLISYFTFKNIPNTSATCYFEAPLGSRLIAGLPDGTKVWLNAGSRLEYTTDYNREKREVKLTGEGFFKVATNPLKPFIVKTSEISIKAYGTAFNVKAYPDEKQVTTTLEEGKIQLEGRGENNKSFIYKMYPRQKVTYYKDDILFKAVQRRVESPKVIAKKAEKEIIPLKTIAPIVSNINVNTVLYTSWKDERWIIQSENLVDLAILLERRFNVKLTFQNEELKKFRFSGTIQNETIEQIFDIMRLTMPITYYIDKGTVTIDIDKTLKTKYRAAYLNNN